MSGVVLLLNVELIPVIPDLVGCSGTRRIKPLRRVEETRAQKRNARSKITHFRYNRHRIMTCPNDNEPMGERDLRARRQRQVARFSGFPSRSAQFGNRPIAGPLWRPGPPAGRPMKGHDNSTVEVEK